MDVMGVLNAVGRIREALWLHHDRRNSVMVNRKSLLLSSTLTIPLLLGGCTQHYEVKEPMSQPCRTAAVHSNAVFYPVQGSIDPSFVFSGAWIENGRMKTTLDGG